MSAIFDEVRAIIVERLGVEEGNVTLEATFKDDLNADSLDVVEMVMAFEDAFDIEIPDEIAEQITNVKGVVEYVEKVKANA
ncbi:MAG: acyl carrier protein [Tumebacillaceae bacterium]